KKLILFSFSEKRVRNARLMRSALRLIVATAVLLASHSVFGHEVSEKPTVLSATLPSPTPVHVSFDLTKPRAQDDDSSDPDQDPGYCKKLLPGLDRMTQGVDIAALDLTPPDITAPTGFLRPIFELTCRQERSWHDPKDSSADPYNIPDQVEGVINVPAGSLTILTRSEQSMKQTKESMAAKVGLEVGSEMYGSFSASKL